MIIPVSNKHIIEEIVRQDGYLLKLTNIKFYWNDLDKRAVPYEEYLLILSIYSSGTTTSTVSYSLKFFYRT
jgi:hypothetical protein